jgi:ATPase subunit of ABC transporter with duplicated ATPase domains
VNIVKRCRKGHINAPATKSNQCKICRKAYSTEYYRKNREKVDAQIDRWRHNNPEKFEAIQKRRRRSEANRQYQKTWREAWLQTEKGKASQQKRRVLAVIKTREWKRKNPERSRKLSLICANRRRARKLTATPKWVNEADLRQVYLDCPAGMEVDHRVPLQGKNVCGLHVPWNLQYLPPSENRRKSNKLLEA